MRLKEIQKNIKLIEMAYKRNERFNIQIPDISDELYVRLMSGKKLSQDEIDLEIT